MDKIQKLKRLKEQYHVEVKPSFRFGITFLRAYKRRNKYYRQFSTKQERSAYQMHLIEYEKYGIRLRASRGNALPTDWDDLPTAIYDAEKCWKTNSKRKNQWYKLSDF